MSDFYEKYVPKWFKVIRWKEWAGRTMYRQKMYALVLYTPFILYYYGEDQYARMLCKYKPKTEEERMKIKREYGGNPNIMNWEIDQYYTGEPPKYDLYERRQQYPQYYGDKYSKDKHKRDGGGIF